MSFNQLLWQKTFNFLPSEVLRIQNPRKLSSSIRAKLTPTVKQCSHISFLRRKGNRYFKYQFVAFRIKVISLIHSISVPRSSRLVIYGFLILTLWIWAGSFINFLPLLRLLSPTVAMIIRLLGQ